VKGTLEGDDAVALRLAQSGLIFARDLDRAFNRFSARVLEKYGVSEAGRTQPVGQLLAFGNSIEIGNVPDLVRLLGQGPAQVGMRVSERIDGDTASKIEIAFALSRE